MSASLPINHMTKDNPIKKEVYKNDKKFKENSMTEYKTSLSKKQVDVKPKGQVMEKEMKRTSSRASQRMSPIKRILRNKKIPVRSESKMSPKVTHKEVPKLIEASHKENSKGLKTRPFDTCKSKLNLTTRTPLGKEPKKEISFTKPLSKFSNQTKGEVGVDKKVKERAKRNQNIPKIVVAESNNDDTNPSFSMHSDIIQTPTQEETPTFNDTSNDEIKRPRRKREDRKKKNNPKENRQVLKI